MSDPNHFKGHNDMGKDGTFRNQNFTAPGHFHIYYIQFIT